MQNAKNKLILIVPRGEISTLKLFKKNNSLLLPKEFDIILKIELGIY